MTIDWGKVVTADQRAALELEAELEKWKHSRLIAVSEITVMVDGLVFDGDEESQGRMARTIASADSLADTTEWTLHDNRVVTVTVHQLKLACRLAGEAQTAIWNEGRPA
ncbi:DUF4376 domain-containing protein [Aeromonas salmonicida]